MHTNIIVMVWVRCHKNFYSCVQIFYVKSDSNEDIHLAHVEPKIKSPEPLYDPHTAIVYQPMHNGQWPEQVQPTPKQISYIGIIYELWKINTALPKPKT